MRINLQAISKKFGSNWIFRNLTESIAEQEKVAIVGANGVGKSTLLKIIAGFVTPNQGSVEYLHHDLLILPDDIYKYLSFSAPYQELPEELTVEELLVFHSSLKPFTEPISTILISLNLDKNAPIRTLSSGMKSRLKFALAFYSISNLLILDEPTANMDLTWKKWYLELMKNDPQKRTTLIGSNEELEYDFCTKIITL